MNNTQDEKNKSLLLSFFKLVIETSFIIICFVLAIIILIVLYFFISYQYDYYRYDKFRKVKPFNSMVWQQTNPQEKGYDDRRYNRCYMYKDLVKNHLHYDMSYDEVVKLLGEPLIVSYYANPKSKGITYLIGDCTKQFNLETSDIRGYSIHLTFTRDSKLNGYGHANDWREKRNLHPKKKGSLFFCDNDSICYRLLESSEPYKDKWEECKKSEVETKWDYRAW